MGIEIDLQPPPVDEGNAGRNLGLGRRLGTGLEPLGWIGAVLVTIGVAWLASKGSLLGLMRQAGDPAALMGLVAAAGFAGAAIGIRAASRTMTDAPSFDVMMWLLRGNRRRT